MTKLQSETIKIGDKVIVNANYQIDNDYFWVGKMFKVDKKSHNNYGDRYFHMHKNSSRRLHFCLLHVPIVCPDYLK